MPISSGATGVPVVRAVSALNVPSRAYRSTPLSDLPPAISGAGAASQSAQTAAGAGLLRFIGSGVDAQAVQVATGAGLERFRATAAPSQAAQAGAGMGRMDFETTGAATQGVQLAVGLGKLRFRGALVAAQPSQAEAGAGSVPVASTAVVGGRWWTTAEVRRPFEIPTISGTGATRQPPQRSNGDGRVIDINEDWLLGMAEDDLLMAA